MPTKKYKVNGKRVPGVTTIISTSLGWGKEGLLHWAWQLGLDGKDFREERKDAATAGTIAHAMAESDIKGISFVPEPGWSISSPEWQKALMAFDAYRSWKEMTQLKCIHSECSFVSTAYRCGGTLDAIAEFGSRRELVDFKTSNHTHPEMLVQLAAYKFLWEHGNCFEWDGPTDRGYLDGVHLLRFSKAGDFHHSYYAASRMEKPWQTFLYLRELYDLKKELEEMV